MKFLLFVALLTVGVCVASPSFPAIPDAPVPDAPVPAIPDTPVPAIPDTPVPAIPDAAVPAIPGASGGTQDSCKHSADSSYCSCGSPGQAV
ncbi:vegetative cell wall protein gp1-like isoform X2 [Contarinia nasturtii]|uniref:vegetative cell wall protein gp1-like isoform X2 n=1 Tax=Contarinia nasturtii TaxID=265458 RepID=UPI0012D42F13|nr:vegetative cell wall protein gp1-like isoform X2 [Contarinia nasturtii]